MPHRKSAERPVDPAVLNTWGGINHFLKYATENQATQLLILEQQGRRRLQYLLRIHARLNKMRGLRERSELLSSSGDKLKPE